MATNTTTLRQKPQKTTLVNNDAVTITDASGNVYYMNVSDLKNALVPALASSADASGKLRIIPVGYTGSGGAGQFETDMSVLRGLIKSACTQVGVYAIQIRAKEETFNNANWNNDAYVNPGGTFYTGIVCNQYGVDSYFSILWLSHVGQIKLTTYVSGTWTNFALTRTQP